MTGFVSDGADGEAPIGHRVTWLIAPRQPFEPMKAFRPRPDKQDFPTREAAELSLAHLKGTYGDRLAGSIQPIYRSKKERENLFKRRQSNLAAENDWPVQARKLTP
jgi:hypothetical protein